MSDPNQPYHNEGFGIAFLTIIVTLFILPALMILSIENGFAKFWEMRGATSDCWENSQHEVVCYNPDLEAGEKQANCKFGRNFCE